ncbi:hypothetical protein [Anthocerotibacter panamensis]|uniref:hypothetical protein n=1 Tax=Anthocerotibacter panamensis TaxID=2857077 RepID=UPI001C4060A3|nr:hypothetical protein [Anthocerotibacter panamensis]
MSIYASRIPKPSSDHIPQPPKPSTKPPVVQAQPVEDGPPVLTYTPLPDDFLTNHPLKQVPGEPASGERRLSPIQIPSVSTEAQRQELVQLNPLKGAAKADEALELAQKELSHLNREMALEMAQAAADLAGIADPTPISDGISAAISLAKGDYLGAGLSLVSMVPYLGDAVGKSIKAARNAKQVGKLVERIREVSTRLQHLSGSARRTALPEVAAKVGEALGTEGRQVKRGYTPKPGERATTREEWYKENSRNRAEQTVSQADQMLEPINPQKATHGHGHADHGYQTTEAQQAERVKSGLKPDGKTSKKLPERASRFTSPEVEAEAIGRGRKALEVDLKNGKVPTFPDPITGKPTYIDPATGEPVRHELTVTTNRVRGFGESMVPQREAITDKLIKNPDNPKHRVPINDPAILPKAQIVWEYVRSIGEWRLVTYFPKP